MSLLQKMLLVLPILCLISGCYEDDAEITINSDGSGLLKQRLVFSERLLVAIEENPTAFHGPKFIKEDIVKEIGSALNIKSIKEIDMPDGKRVIELEGTFSNAEQFFLSEYCREQIKLRLTPAGKGKAGIHCDLKTGETPSLARIYGMAKGLHISRTVHLPAKIEETNGSLSKDKKTVSWSVNLRNKEALAKTRVFIEGVDAGKGTAIIDASSFEFNLPLKVSELSEKVVAAEKEKAGQQSNGLAAEVSWISIVKTKGVDGNDIAKKSYTEIGVNLTWDKAHPPVRYMTPVLLSLLDDWDNDLVTSDEPPAYSGKISKHRKKKEIKLKEKAPSKNARKLKNLEGYVEVITDAVIEKVVLENVHELAGKESTGNAALDKLQFKIKSIENNKLKIAIGENTYKITSINMIKDDGSKVKKGGHGGWAGDYSYEFNEDISQLKRCELEVVVAETIVKVPFSLKEMLLP